MRPVERYREALQQPGIKVDPAQALAVEHLDRLYTQLQQRQTPPSFWTRLTRKLEEAPQGVYLWGGTGRGKTWLMDLFYAALPTTAKRRIHFHQFMNSVHEQLAEIKRKPDPLSIVAGDVAAEMRVLCLDEFIVTNIADAMLLYGLLRRLFNHGVVLVATSNRPPDDLYLNGLQRDRFLPAIRLIKQATQVLAVDGAVDYRLGLLEQGDLLYCPEPADPSVLAARFVELAATEDVDQQPININHRTIEVLRRADDVIWFSFAALCDTPRSASDYLEIARQFHTVMVSGIPMMPSGLDAQARRFIYLIDALYDQRVKLILACAVHPGELYRGIQLAFPFRRTASRLEEMRSHQYLAKSHRA